MKRFPRTVLILVALLLFVLLAGPFLIPVPPLKGTVPLEQLADPDHVVADLSGQEVNPVTLGRMPTQFVIDKKGQIRYQHYGGAMWDIPSNEEIFALLDRLNHEENT